jgi:uncharacterized membrane protein YgcG
MSSLRLREKEMRNSEFLCFALSVAAATAFDEIPNPTLDPALCGASAASFLCDPDEVLEPAEATAIRRALSALARDIQLPACGAPGEAPGRAQLGVAVVRRLRSADGRLVPLATTTAEGARRAAKDTHKAWGVGDARCDSGALLLVVVDDRKIHLSTGRGARAQGLSDALVAQVTSRMKRPFRRRAYGEGIAAAVRQLAVLLAGELPPGFAVAAPATPMISGWTAAALVGLLLAGVGAALWAAERQQRRYIACKASLRRVEQARAERLARRFDAQSCAICLEPFRGATAVPEDGQAAAAEPAAPTRILLCGHRFHRRCCDAWLAQHPSCPVCRCSVDGRPPATSAPAPAPAPSAARRRRGRSQRGAAGGGSTCAESCAGAECAGACVAEEDEDDGVDDLLLRWHLAQVRADHSELLTEEMVSDWERRAAAGGHADAAAAAADALFTKDEAFMQLCPSYNATPAGESGGVGGDGADLSGWSGWLASGDDGEDGGGGGGGGWVDSFGGGGCSDDGGGGGDDW